MSNIHSFPIPSRSPFLETVIRLSREAFASQSFKEDPCAGLWLMASTIAREVTPDLRGVHKQEAIAALGCVISKYNILGSDGAAVDGATILAAAIAGDKPQLISRAAAPTTSTASAPAVANYSGPLLQSAPASSFKMKRIRWAWPNRIAIGELALIVGMPDEGKGQILYYSAAKVTRGGEWPCGEGIAPKGRVLLLTAEDNIHSVVVPRLLAAGADLDQVEIIQMVEADGGKRMFSLVTDLPLLRQKIERLGDVKLVLVDPIASYLSGGAGKKDYRGNTVDVRSVLDPLVDMAAELNVAIMGVMHFNKKQDVTNVMLRTSDSLAFTAIARQVYGAIDDPENGRKLFVKGKNNIADRAYSDKTLAYRFASKKVGTDEETGEDIIAPFIVWDDDHVDITADEAMSATKSPAARDEAKKFLADMLADGPVLTNEVKDAASGNGISERTLKRAKQELGVQAEKDGATGKWSWHLPGKSKPPTKH